MNNLKKNKRQLNTKKNNVSFYYYTTKSIFLHINDFKILHWFYLFTRNLFLQWKTSDFLNKFNVSITLFHLFFSLQNTLFSANFFAAFITFFSPPFLSLNAVLDSSTIPAPCRAKGWTHGQAACSRTFLAHIFLWLAA